MDGRTVPATSSGSGAVRSSPRIPALCLLLVATGLASARGAEPLDLVIRGGRVIDGSGNPAIRADVAVQGGRIVAVGLVEASGRTEIDAGGRVVCPGFIDVHTHAENLVDHPTAENFLRMGVTTLVTGNCGSAALDTGAFFERVRQAKPTVNLATLAGHNTLRREAMGGNFDREPTAGELEEMRRLLARSMDAGAVGLSTGLIYLPGTFSRAEEIIALARVAAERGGIYASHMRNEGTRIDSALDELFRIAREAGIRAQISHIKLGSNAAWGNAAKVLARIDAERAAGVEVTQDQYAYTASSTSLSQMIPSSAREGGPAEFRARVSDPARKAAIFADMKQALAEAGRRDYSHAVIASFRPQPALNGKTIPQAALAVRGADDLDNQIELILWLHEQGSGQGVYHGMREDDVRLFMSHPNTMVASDSGVREPDGALPHPRGYGNNARVLGRYVRELKLLRLEDAVRKMTSLPAGAFRLMDRGLVRPGAAADLVILDPAVVADPATFADPHQYARGIDDVVVNGVAVLRSGHLTGAAPGAPVPLPRAPRIGLLRRSGAG